MYTASECRFYLRAKMCSARQVPIIPACFVAQ